MSDSLKSVYPIFLLGLLLCGFQTAAICQLASTTYIQRWTENEGLPSDNVYHVMKDRHHQMWIATSTALCRFNGQEFDCFAVDPKNKEAIQGNQIIETREAEDGKIWIATDGGGLSIFDPKTETFQTLRQNSDDPDHSLTEDRVYEIYPLPGQDQFIIGYRAIGSGQGGISLIDSEANILAHHLKGQSDYANFPIKITQIWIDPNEPDIYWLGGRSFFRYDTKSDQLEEFVHPSFQKNYTSVVGIEKLNDSILVVAPFYGGLCTFNMNQGQWSNPVDDYSCYDINRDESGQIWVANQNGLGIYNHNDQSIDYKIARNRASSPLPKNVFIRSFTLDGSSVWLSTNQGLFCWSPLFQDFQNLNIQLASGQTASYPQFVGLADPSDYWIVAQGAGLLRVDSSWQVLNSFPLPGDISNTRVFQLSNGDILVGGTLGLFHFSPVGNSNRQAGKWYSDWSDWETGSVNLDSIQVWSFFEDHNQVLWIGTRYNGLLKLDFKTNQLKQFLHNPEQVKSLSHNNYLFDLTIGPDDHLWIGSDKGISILDLESETFVLYPNLQDRINTFVIHDVQTDPYGNIWIGTRNQGLFKYDPESDLLNWFTEADGLPYNGVNEIALQGDRMWLGTRQGLVRYDFKDGSFKTYDQSRGLAQKSLYSARMSTLPSGDVMLTHQFSPDFTIISANKDFGSQRPPRVHIQSLRSLDRASNFILYPDLSDTIRLAANQNYFAIDFTGIQFSSNQNLEYRYQLVGYDSDWIESGTNNAAIYTHLPGGRYQFQVQVTDSNGIVSSISSLSIFLATPWYAQNRSIFLFVMLFILILYLLYRWRTQQIQKEADLKRLIAETEMKALRAQINPHFIFNCLNSIKSFIIDNDIDAGTTYVSRFSRLIRMILNASKEKLVPIHQEIELIELYLWLEQERLDHRFETTTTIKIQSPKAELFIPPMLLQPFLENAIWHGIMNLESGGWINLIVEETSNHLMIRIEDNGVGRRFSQEMRAASTMKRTSMGIEISKSRLEQISDLYQLDAKIEIFDLYPEREHSGTVVTIQLPKIKTRQHVESDHD